MCKHKSNCSIKAMNNTTSNPESNDEFNAGGFTYGVGFVIGIILLVLSVAFACIRLRRISNGPDVFGPVRGISPAAGGAAQSTQGLDETSLDSFPKLLFSDIQKKSSVSSSCSICYEDYKETDTLRLLPDCGHGFHLACVDPWLRLHATCPICRSSSIQAPQSSSSRGDRVIIVG